VLYLGVRAYLLTDLTAAKPRGDFFFCIDCIDMSQPMRIFYLGVLGAGVLVGSFLTTLWLTEPTTPPDIKPALPSIKSDILAASLVRDEGTLPAAANAAGLKPSDKLKGVVDAVTRLNSALK
jgi:hypothetical protein